MVKIVWSALAVSELRDIYLYISIDSIKYANNQISRIRQKTQILKSMPEIGRIVPELEENTIRELIEGNYRIVYRINTINFIEILTIHHASRNFNTRNIQ